MKEFRVVKTTLEVSYAYVMAKDWEDAEDKIDFIEEFELAHGEDKFDVEEVEQ